MAQVQVSFEDKAAAIQARRKLRKQRLLGRGDRAYVYGRSVSDRQVPMRHTDAVRGAIIGTLLVALGAAVVGVLAAPTIHMSVVAAGTVGLIVGGLYGLMLGMISFASQPKHTPMLELGANAVLIVDAKTLTSADRVRRALLEEPTAMAA